MRSSGPLLNGESPCCSNGDKTRETGPRAIAPRRARRGLPPPAPPPGLPATARRAAVEMSPAVKTPSGQRRMWRKEPGEPEEGDGPGGGFSPGRPLKRAGASLCAMSKDGWVIVSQRTGAGEARVRSRLLCAKELTQGDCRQRLIDRLAGGNLTRRVGSATVKHLFDEGAEPMETIVYLCRKCGQVLRDTASPADDTTRAVGWCVRCGTWGWGDRKRWVRPDATAVEPAAE
jgi:hypothetical protein